MRCHKGNGPGQGRQGRRGLSEYHGVEQRGPGGALASCHRSRHDVSPPAPRSVRSGCMTDAQVSSWLANPLPFAQLLGLEVLTVAPDRVEAELRVRDELCTRPAVLHGGAVMALADTLGAIATVANLPEGATTTTIESKTNFFAAIPLGDTARAECTPLHRGRTTMVWQTKITRGDGRVAALVIQTQLVLPASR